MNNGAVGKPSLQGIKGRAQATKISKNVLYRALVLSIPKP